MVQRIPTFKPTQAQRDWLESEKKRTGNAFAVILKGLIQEKIDNGDN